MPAYKGLVVANSMIKLNKYDSGWIGLYTGSHTTDTGTQY